MDLVAYSVFTFFYIMIIHFAIGISNEFKLFLMIGLFIVGAVLGAGVHSYPAAFIGVMIVSWMLW